MRTKKTIKEEKAEVTEIVNLSGFEEAMTDKSTPLLDELNLRLFVAVMLGTASDVTKVIKEGANVNALNLNKVCPLELAKAHKRKNVVKILEANGAHLQIDETQKKRPSKKN